ncbi:cyclase [Rhodothalassium salexigens]|uniref:cyclase family protein n=1 Tax=Rhodothalassium salexigens TaxID=1086 RepID=UPI0019137224|nr:cyclase family protein [Rhodothalassium salexigens]MBK5912187.1 cyclase [Rhodothalassium salexigens]MBK5919943.1 cyclase [Rhodothalassium salexigens]
MASDVLNTLVAALASGGVRVVDLTRPLEPATPVLHLPPQFAQSPPFSIEEISRYDERGPAWYWNKFACGEHTGTHFDAPVHWITGKDHADNATDTIPPERFVGPACVIDVVDQVAADADFLLTPDHVLAWEAAHGRIPRDSWVLIRTGWSARTEPEAFLNMAEDGPHTPGLAPETPRFLAEARDILGVGVETVGTDAGQAAAMEPPFPCHALMHGANKFGLASLANLDQLPATGAVVIAPPLKIVGGSGSPLRVLALVPGG